MFYRASQHSNFHSRTDYRSRHSKSRCFSAYVNSVQTLSPCAQTKTAHAQMDMSATASQRSGRRNVITHAPGQQNGGAISPMSRKRQERIKCIHSISGRFDLTVSNTRVTESFDVDTSDRLCAKRSTKCRAQNYSCRLPISRPVARFVTN